MRGSKGKPVSEEIPRLPDLTNPNDITIWNPGQPVYSRTNPHPILGRLDPSPSWFVKTVTFLLGDDGEPLLDREGNPIRDWPGWPRYISSQIGGHDMEVLFRSSCRVTYKDIWARQPCWVKAPNSTMTNRMNQRRLREGRLPFGGICWSQRYITRASPKTLAAAVADLSADQIRYNTNFPIQDDRIIAGSQVLPLDYYISTEGIHKPSVMVYDALVLIHELAQSTRALRLLHWMHLPEKCLPSDWRTRGYAQRAQNAAIARAQDTDNSPKSRRRRRASKQTLSNKKRRLDLQEQSSEALLGFEWFLSEDWDEDTGAGTADLSKSSFQHAYETYRNFETTEKKRAKKAKRDIWQWLYGSVNGLDREDFLELDDDDDSDESDEDDFEEVDDEESEEETEEETEEVNQEEDAEVDDEENEENTRSNDEVYDDEVYDDELDGEFEYYDENDFNASAGLPYDSDEGIDAPSSDGLYDDEGNDEVNDFTSDIEREGGYEADDDDEVDTATNASNEEDHCSAEDSVYEDEQPMAQTLAPEAPSYDTDASEEGLQTPARGVHSPMYASYSSSFSPHSSYPAGPNFLYEDRLDDSEDGFRPLARFSSSPLPPPAAPGPRLFYNEAGEAFTNYIDSLPETWVDPAFQF
ncbi:hypothetical protein MMC27_003932 [Xylographa pallens]|nr:hypothetical protein [Xylographa pallens]